MEHIEKTIILAAGAVLFVLAISTSFRYIAAENAMIETGKGVILDRRDGVVSNSAAAPVELDIATYDEVIGMLLSENRAYDIVVDGVHVAKNTLRTLNLTYLMVCDYLKTYEYDTNGNIACVNLVPLT